MTAPTPEAVAAIAAKLTRAQRRAVLAASRGEVLLPDESCDEMVALGITGHDGWIDQLTPFGLAVRAHLLAQEPAK